ncbi:MAG: cyclic nucleotide-binding domain-containing protein [Chloroflexi bacterium]|nr:cyclic nucleotide-binding domain-containing protein [Chloroflexota bacterium]
MVISQISLPLLLQRECSESHRDPAGDSAMAGVLRTNRLLRNVGDDWFSQLISAGWRMEFGRDQVISHQGQLIDAVIFIVDGEARAEIHSASGRACKAVIGLLGPGDDIGSTTLVNGASHFATVTAMKTVRTVHIPVEAMRACLQRHGEWYRILAEAVAERLLANGIWLQALL